MQQAFHTSIYATPVTTLIHQTFLEPKSLLISLKLKFEQVVTMTSKKTFIILCFAFAVSALGVFMLYSTIEATITAKQATNTAKPKPKPTKLIKLVGTQRRLIPGETLKLADITPLDIPVKIAKQQDYVLWQDRQDLINQRLILTLPSQAAIRYSDLSTTQYMVFSDQLNAGERAMTIPVDAFSSIYGYLQPKDHIDLLLVSTQNNQKQTISLVENIEVLATDLFTQTDLTQPTLPNSGEINAITLRVNAMQASRIALGQSLGELVLLMRNQQTIDVSKVNHAASPLNSQEILGPIKNDHYKPKFSVEMIVGGS